MDVKLIRIHGVNLRLFDEEKLLDIVNLACVGERKTAIVCADFRLLNSVRKGEASVADEILCYPDSTGMNAAMKFLFPFQCRGFKKLVSTDINNEILKAANTNMNSLFLLGATDKILLSFTKKLKEEYPNIRIAGSLNGFEDANSNALLYINSCKPDILFVGMGVPKQEIWVNENYDKINVSLIVTVGAFFSFYSGHLKRAPRWLRRLSMEWLFRLFQEPNRLWKRYIVEYPMFLFNLITERVNK